MQCWLALPGGGGGCYTYANIYIYNYTMANAQLELQLWDGTCPRNTDLIETLELENLINQARPQKSRQIMTQEAGARSSGSPAITGAGQGQLKGIPLGKTISGFKPTLG